MRISASRSQLIWSPLVGWALLSCAVMPAWAQAPAPAAGTPDATTTTPTIVPGAGGAQPSGTTYGSILTPPPGTPVKPGTTPDGTNADGTAPDGSIQTGGPTAGSTSRTTTTSSTTSSFAGVPNPQTAAPSLTSSSGVLLYGAPVGSSIPLFDSGGGGGGGPSGPDLGITMGSFTLFPVIDVTTGLDNNVFAQNANAGTTASPYMTIVPSLELRSDWLNHQLRVALTGGFGFYSKAPTQNYQNYGLTVDGRVDIREDFYLTPSIGFKRATEALGTPNVSFAQAPTVVDTVPVKLGVYQRFNRFFYDISGTATRYWHYDNSVITSSGLPASSRDRWEYAETFKFGYELTDDFSLYVAPTISQIRYIQPINAADQQRDNNSLGMGIGATWILSPTSSFDGSFGYTSRNYTSGMGSTGEFTGTLAGSWNGYTPLTLRPTFSRSIQETALSGFKNMVLTTAGLDFNYVIREAWTIVGGISYSLSDYTPADGTGSTAREDKVFRGQIGFMYAFRPQIAIGPLFEYTNGSTTDPTAGPLYDRQVISIRLTARR